MEKPILLFEGAERPPLTIVGSHLGSGSVSFTNVKKRSYSEHERTPNDQAAKAKFESVVENLKAIIQKILNGEPLQRSYSSIYKDVELVLMFKHSEQGKLADWILKAIDEHFDTKEIYNFRGLIDQGINDPHALAGLFLDTEHNWSRKIGLILKLFIALDRAYLHQHPKKKDIVTHCSELFVRRLLKNESGELMSLNGMLLKLCGQITFSPERTINSTSELQAQRLVSFMNGMNAVVDYSFPSAFQTLTIANYTKLQHIWMEDEASYLANAMQAIHDEYSFLRLVLFKEEYVIETIKKLQWLLIFQDFANVLCPSIPTLMKSENLHHWETLLKVSKISESYYGVNSMKIVLFGWRNYVVDVADELIENCKALGTSVILGLFELWSRLTTISHEPEQLDFEMRTSLGKAMLKKEHNRFILLQLSKFFESMLKLPANGDEKFEKSFKESLMVFNLMPNKQEFLVMYERDVSRRFLLGRAFNLQAETRLFKAMLELLGEGADTTNLSNMFKDIENSFSRYNGMHLKAAPSVQFNALVLEGSHWPEMPKQGANAVLPSILSDMLSEFTVKYARESEKHKLRVLDWSNYTFHQLTIKVRFKSKPKELTLTLAQAIVLLLFEEQNVLEYQEVASKTQLDDKLLSRVISSLSSERYPILLAEGATFTFNENFSDKASRIRLPLGRDRDAPSKDEAAEKIARSRTSEIQAALVRVMKSAKTLTYPELLGKTTEILKVPVSVQDLKVQVDHLITTEFFKRGEQDSTLCYIP